MTITKDTQVCISIAAHPGNFGCYLHNAAFAAKGLNFIYKAFGVQDLENAVRGVRALGIRGCSVSMPFKEAVRQYLDELDPAAARIGAVNTIINTAGRLKGYNTDWEGAMRALTEHIDLRHKQVVLFGAGGVARAIAFGLSQSGVKELTIVNRSEVRAAELAKRVRARYVEWGGPDRQKLYGDLMINATPIGMAGYPETELVDERVLRRFSCILDVVVSLRETALIRRANALGLVTVPGFRMSLFQAAKQFELYTEQAAPIEIMEKAIQRYLTGEV